MSTRAPWRKRGRAGLFPAALISLSRAILAMVLLVPVFPNGVCAALPPVDLTDFSLEELMNLRVTSTARRPQTVAESPAAVFVITQDDIRRSGVTSIPEALRMAPGVDVARIDGNKWAISVRGFNGRFANKLLVMIDGRSVYTPPTSGVLWDAQDTVLEDAVSRAVRTPSQSAEGISINSVLPAGDPDNPLPIPLQIAVLGNPGLASEHVTSFELGYRVRPTDDLSLDFASFYNRYDNLLSVETSAPLGFVPCPTPPFFVCAVGTTQFDNLGSATAYGFEASADWRVTPWWRLQSAYSYLHVDVDHDRALGFTVSANGRDPSHVVSLRSSFGIAEDWEFDLWGRNVSDLPERGVENYCAFDARLGWRPFDGLEFALVGQNLFDGHHLEFTPELINTTPTEVARAVYGKVTVTF